MQSSRTKPLYDSLSQKGSIHSFLIDALKEVESSNHLGNVLYGMHRRRRVADYALQTVKNWDKEVDDNVSDAEEILKNISRVQTLFSQKSFEIDNLITLWHAESAKYLQRI